MDISDELVEEYNNTKHSSIGMIKPFKAHCCYVCHWERNYKRVFVRGPTKNSI